MEQPVLLGHHMDRPAVLSLGKSTRRVRMGTGGPRAGDSTEWIRSVLRPKGTDEPCVAAAPVSEMERAQWVFE